MKPIRFLKLLCLALIGFAPALPAVEFRALSWDNAIANVTYPGRSAGAPLSISAAALSPWQKITPSADGIEFKILPPPDQRNPAKPTEAPAPTLLAKVLWPVGLNRALLLFVPAPAGSPTPYVAIVIPERDSDTKPSSVRAFNYSNRDVALRLGTQTPAQLAPLANLDNDERPDSGALPIVLAYQEEDRWRLVADTSLALPPGFSAYLFIRSLPRFDLEPNNPQVGYKLIYDRLPASSSPPSSTNPPTPAP